MYIILIYSYLYYALPTQLSAISHTRARSYLALPTTPNDDDHTIPPKKKTKKQTATSISF